MCHQAIPIPFGDSFYFYWITMALEILHALLIIWFIMIQISIYSRLSVFD